MIHQIQNYIIGFLIITIIAGFFYFDYKLNASENEKLELRNTIAEKDSIIHEKDGSYSRLSLQYNSQKDLNKLLSEQNKQLADEIKDKDEEIAYLVAIKVKPDKVYVGNANTTIKDSIATFNGYTKPFNVSGQVNIKDTTTKNLKVIMDEFKLLTLGTKIENGFYKTKVIFTDLNNNPLDMFKVKNIESAINTNPDNISESYFNLGFGTKLSLNELTPGTQLKLGQNNFIIGYKLFDRNIDLNKLKLVEKIEFSYYRMF